MSNDSKPGALLNVRVLDETVVDELSTRLLNVLERASGAVGELTDGLARSETVTGEAEQARTELQRRLQLGVRLVQAADRSAATLEPLLTGLDERGQSSERAAAEVEEAVARLQEELRAAAEGITNDRFSAEHSFNRLREQVEHLTTRLETGYEDLARSRAEWQAEREQLDNEREAFRAGAADASKTFAECDRTAEEVAARLDEKLGVVRADIESGDRALREHEATVDAARRDLETRVTETRAELEEAREDLAERHEAALAAGAALDHLNRQLDERITGAARDLEERRGAAEVAGKTVTEGAAKFQSDFAAAVAYLETRKQKLDGATGGIADRLDTYTSEVEAQRQDLAADRAESEAVRAATKVMLDELHDELASATGHFRERLDQQGRALHERVERATGELESGTQAYGELRETVESRFRETADNVRAAAREIQDRVDPVTEQLGDLRDRTEATAVRLEDTLAESQMAQSQAKADLDTVRASVETVAVEQAARVNAFDERLQQALADLRSDRTARTEEAERLGAHRAELEALRAAVEASVTALEERMATVREDVEEAAAGVQGHAVRVVQGVDEFNRGADGAQVRLNEIIRRADVVEEELRDAARQLDERQEQRYRELTERVEPVVRNLERGQAAAATAQVQVVEEVAGSRAQVSEALEELGRGREELTAMESRLNARLTSFDHHVERGEAELTARGRDLAQARVELDDRINELYGRVAEAKNELEQTIGAAADDSRRSIETSIADLSSRQEAATALASGLETRIADLQTDLHAELAETLTEFEQEKSRREQAAAALEERAKETSSRLASCVKRAEEIERGFDEQQAAAVAGAEEGQTRVDRELAGMQSTMAEAVAAVEGACRGLEQDRSSLEERGAGLESRVNEAVGRLEHRMESVNHAEREELTAVRREMEAAVQQTRDRGAARDAAAEDIQSTIRVVREELKETRSRLEERATHVDEAMAEFGRRCEKMSEMVRSPAAAAGPSDGEVLAIVEDRVAELRGQVERAVRTAVESATAGLERRLKPVIGLVTARGLEAAERSAEQDKWRKRLERELAEIRSKAAKDAERAATAHFARSNGPIEVEIVESLRKQIEDLRDEVAGAAKSVEECRRRSDEVGTRLEDEIPSLREELSGLAGRFDGGIDTRTGERMERLESALDEIGTRVPSAGADDPLTAAQVAQIESRIAEAIAGAETDTHTAEDAIERIEAQCTSLEKQLRESLDALDRRVDEAARAAADRPGPAAVPVPAPASVKARPAPGVLAPAPAPRPTRAPTAAAPAAAAPATPPPATAPGRARGSSDPLALLDTPDGARIKGFVDAVNIDDPEAARGFILTSYAQSALKGVAMSERLAVYAKLREMSRGLEIRGLYREEPDEMLLLAQARGTGEWYGLLFQYESESPRGILSVAIDPLDADEAQRKLAS